MDHTHPQYVLHTDLKYLLDQMMDFIKSNFEALDNEIKKVNTNLYNQMKVVHSELHHEIQTVRYDVQTYKEENSRVIAEIKATNEELRDMNKHILGLIS